MHSIAPFRWNIRKRHQLGTLLEHHTLHVAPSVAADVARLGRLSGTIHGEPYTWLVDELTRCSAKLVALAGNADLCFVGRSPESVFDYLSGLLLTTSWHDRLSLLHFSFRFGNMNELQGDMPHALSAFQQYLTALQLDPVALMRRPRPVALVDIVATGSTFGNLITLLHAWCHASGSDWHALQHKLRIVGLTQRTKTSPKTWRWHQHAPWVALLAPGTIKNVSIPAALFHYLGEAQTKVSRSYAPPRWGNPDVALPQYDPQTLQALALAVALFDHGQHPAQRAAWTQVLRQQPAMQQVWCRDLVRELRG